MSRIVYLVGRTVDGRQGLQSRKMASCGNRAFLHLVPTRGRVMELECDPAFWLSRRVDTLSRVIQEIFEEHIRLDRFRDWRPIDDQVRCLLIKKVLERRRELPDGLSYFSQLPEKRDADNMGVYRDLSDFFSLLVRNNFEDLFAEDLGRRMIRLDEEIPGSAEGRYSLESDLAWLFGDFEEIKREIKGYDAGDVFSAVRSFLAGGGTPGILAERDVLVFDGFVHISRIEEDILFYFFQHVEEVWWLLDYEAGAGDPIEGFKKSAGREPWPYRVRKAGGGRGPSGRHEAYRIFTPFVSLMERLEASGCDTGVEEALDGPFSNPVANGLYFHGEMDNTPRGGLKVRSFENRIREVEAIAGEIKRIVHEQKLDTSRDLGRFRIIFPDLRDYSCMLLEVFSAYKLASSVTKGLPLSSHPVTDLFCQIFEVPLNDFSREDIFRLFSSPLLREGPGVPLSVEECLVQIKKGDLLEEAGMREAEGLVRGGLEEGARIGWDAFLFDRVARRCGLRTLGGGDLSRVKDYYRDQLAQEGSRGARRDILLEYVQFHAQIGLLEKRLAPFRDLGDQGHPQAIADGLFRILDGLGFPENLVRFSEAVTLETAMIRTMVKRDMKVYSILKDLILASANEAQIARELFDIKGGRSLLARFYAIFRSRLDRAYLLDERDPNVIRVSEWLEIRGRSFDYVFAGGLTADRFPLRDGVNFLIPDSPRKEFRIPDPMDQSKHLFSHLLRNCRKGVYLSYPRYMEEKEAQPSPVLVDLESMVEPDPQLHGGIEILEGVFPWEANPYFTSGEDLIDATRPKPRAAGQVAEGLFPLKQIVVKDDATAEDLAGQINALSSRWAMDGLFQWDGLVEEASGFQEFLKARRDTFSPTQLEILANCPMRYLFQYVYGLKTLEELGREVSPKDMGGHLHALLGAFFKVLKREGKNVADMGLQQAFSLAREVSDLYWMEYPFLKRLEFFDFQKREFLAGLEKTGAGKTKGAEQREGVFARLLRYEEREFRDRVPAGIEYGFGREGDPRVTLGKTGIQGYVDRFDRGKEDEQKVYIYDYKTGRTSGADMVKKGLSFQLPVYACALKTTLETEGISAAFYSLRRTALSEGNPMKGQIHDHWEGVGGLDVSGVKLIGQYVDELMTLVQQGYFHHSADEVICPYCEFRYACYKDMRRMHHLLESDAGRRIYSGDKNLERWKTVDDFRQKWKAASRSMHQAFNLKTRSARERHFESVMGFKEWLLGKGDSLPLDTEYIGEILAKIEDFRQRYQAD